MICIEGRFTSYGEVWFDEEPPQRSGVDVLMFRYRPSPLQAGVCKRFRSLASDLTEEPEAMMARFGGTNRYKIKRAESKDGLTFEFMSDAAAHLDEFFDFYDGFARQKKLPPAYRRGVEAASAAGCLVLSAASHAGKRIVWHAYVRSAGAAALLHSASHYRSSESVDRALVGRANRWLHWKDMLAFRADGVVRYDWGGMFDDESVPEHASVNSFKREFGGAAVETYNCSVAQTLKGRAYTACSALLARLRGE